MPRLLLLPALSLFSDNIHSHVSVKKVYFPHTLGILWLSFAYLPHTWIFQRMYRYEKRTVRTKLACKKDRNCTFKPPSVSMNADRTKKRIFVATVTTFSIFSDKRISITGKGEASPKTIRIERRKQHSAILSVLFRFGTS